MKITRHALIVGINAYPDAPLTGCVADADDVMDAMFKRWGDRLAVSRLVDSDATRENILVGLRYLVADTLPGERALFYFSGHGTQVPGYEDGRWEQAIVPVDYMTGAFIVDNEVNAILSGMHPESALTVVTDCCFSGSITRLFSPSAQPASRALHNRREKFLPLTGHLRRLYERNLRRGKSPLVRAATRSVDDMHWVHFAACRDTEVAWEINGRGYFTQHFTALVRKAAPTETHLGVQRDLIQNVGSNPIQTPQMECNPAMLRKPIFGRQT